mgnify:CR=1 FL=1
MPGWVPDNLDRGLLDAVGEWEEGITREHGALQRNADARGLLTCRVNGIDARGRTAAQRQGPVGLDEGDGVTHLTLRGRPIRASAEERAFFNQFKPNVAVGFNGTFQQLEAFLGLTPGG